MSLKIASLTEKRSIYEIFRSCRLCGAGGGYKMPIIQNVVDLDDTDVELSQKIKECVQIEVSIDDKMPPLICELCIDKINDFYEFQSLCKNTNHQTRTRLGLPPQNRSSSPVEESILGVTEALCERSDNETIQPRSTTKQTKSKLQPKSKKVTVKVEIEHTPPPQKPSRRSSPVPTKYAEPTRKDSRAIREHGGSGGVRNSRPVTKAEGSKSRIRFESSSSLSPPPPRRMTRTKTSDELFEELAADGGAVDGGSGRSSVVEDDELCLRAFKERKQASKPGPKSKQSASLSPKGTARQQPSKDTKVVKEKVPPPPIQTTTKGPSNRSSGKKDKLEEEQTKSAKKRPHDKESSKPTVPAKKAKPTTKQREKRDQPKTPAPKVAATPTVPIPCEICAEVFMSNAAKQNHARTHVVTFTEPRLSCNACEDWFSTYVEAAEHHKWHRTGPNPYTCSVCTFDYDTLNEYNVHIENYSCRKLYEEPDVQCLDCWNDFPTKTSLENHKCLGEDGRPGGKCSKCGKMYALLKNLINHEISCTKERCSTIDPEILYKIKPTEILVAKCDKLLEKKVGLRFDVSRVPHDYGVDPNSYYPYLKKRLAKIKTESAPFDGMVNINDDIRKQIDEFANSDFSNDDGDDNIEFGDEKPKKLQKLSKLCLKTMSESESFSKNSSKRKKVKTEVAFDDLLNDDQPAYSQSYNFDSLIDSLDDKNTDSGEESVIKDFGLFNSNENVENKDNSIKSDEVSKSMDEKSPVKLSGNDIDKLSKSDNDNKQNNHSDNENISVTKPIDDSSTMEKDNLAENDNDDRENDENKNETISKPEEMDVSIKMNNDNDILSKDDNDKTENNLNKNKNISKPEAMDVDIENKNDICQKETNSTIDNGTEKEERNGLDRVGEFGLSINS